MKNYILRIFTLIIALFCCTLSFAQYKKGEVLLNDSTKLIGYIKFRGFSNGIKYKERTDGKSKKISAEKIKLVTITGQPLVERYSYMKLNKKSLYVQLVKVEKTGKINLYSQPSSKYGSSSSEGISFQSRGNRDYYIEKNNEIIRLGPRLQDANLHHIMDCPELLKKLGNKEFKRKHIPQMIAFYNKECN